MLLQGASNRGSFKSYSNRQNERCTHIDSCFYFSARTVHGKDTGRHNFFDHRNNSYDKINFKIFSVFLAMYKSQLVLVVIQMHNFTVWNFFKL